ncbi:MAG: M1 family metallopeptidase [Bacteroidetes bacterium]|nr:M1 family metallopeptidase [Bacteroidota bacterium]
MMKKLIFIPCFLCLSLLPISYINGQTDILDSGGHLPSEQASYDVRFYDLKLQLNPEERFISGKLTVEAKIVQPLNTFILDLDSLLQVEMVRLILPNKSFQKPDFKHINGKINIALVHTRQPGETIKLEVWYSGKPRIAPNPPWEGGFTFSRTPSGAHWIATSCQTNGADLWWPVKDHVSDEPDSMAIHIRVPDPLVVASNGKLTNIEKHSDATSTYHWFVSTPINVYNVALNIAPYLVVDGKMKSIAGDEFPVVFYALPEDFEKAKKLFPEIISHLQFYEKYLGPYPFRKDKYGVAQTPHLGMEHQTIIAYGAKYNNGSMTGGKDWGFDALHHHELGHEWWGNLVTNADWKDMWIHEGFCSYMQALYQEDRLGKEAYLEYIHGMRRFTNSLPIAPVEIKTAKEIYRAPIYNKGAWTLHTLRYLLGDKVFFKVLHKMAYPDAAMEQTTDGSACRFVHTDDFIQICEAESGLKLSWFFNIYVRQPVLPELERSIENNILSLKWKTPGQLPFPMPVTIKVGKEWKRIEIPVQGIKIPFEGKEAPVVDPEGWVLKL